MGILRNNFHPRYCFENLGNTFTALEGDIFNIAVPMVCFCDIPLSQIKEHIDDYGCYALGLSKDWAVRMHLNPVIYLTPDSLVSRYLITIMKNAANSAKSPEDLPESTVAALFDLIGFVKPYRGPFIRNGKPEREKIYYNEREWRYIPLLVNQTEVPYRLNHEEFSDHEIKTRSDKLLSERAVLHFEPGDVNYILISQEREILELVRQIEDVKGHKYSLNDVRILTTKIVTIDKILKDM
jgi:hypothetical protein